MTESLSQIAARHGMFNPYYGQGGTINIQNNFYGGGSGGYNIGGMLNGQYSNTRSVMMQPIYYSKPMPNFGPFGWLPGYARQAITNSQIYGFLNQMLGGQNQAKV